MAEQRARTGMDLAGYRAGRGFAPAGVWLAAAWLLCLSFSLAAQTPGGSDPRSFAGRSITAVRFEGVNEDRLNPLAAELRDDVGKPLSAQLGQEGGPTLADLQYDSDPKRNWIVITDK